MRLALLPHSANESTVVIVVVIMCIIGGRYVIRSIDRANNPTGSSRLDSRRGPQFPTSIVSCPRPFTSDDFARLQVGMTSAMVLQSLGFQAKSDLYTRRTQLPHHFVQFIASDGQIIDVEFRKGALKNKQYFASEKARQEDIANTLW